MRYDFLIVGAGLFGSVFAYLAKQKGYKCLILDKRNHIGGNCYTEKRDDIDVHIYGPHIFNTNNKEVWDFVNTFDKFNNFIYTPKALYKDRIYSLPINMMTFHQFFGVLTPEQAKKELEKRKIKINNPSNLEEHILSQVGEEIYETLIKEYTKKQWGRDPKDLPAFIIKRIPIRFDFNENYFNSKYQGIPENGYTYIFEKLIKDIDIETEVDYNKKRVDYSSIAKNVIYTGCIDEYFDFTFGELEYRTLHFNHQKLDISESTGNVCINFTDEEMPWTRLVEHRFFTFKKDLSVTHVTYENAFNFNRREKGLIPSYPINNSKNNKIFEKYKEETKKLKNVFFGGRLAEYKYYNMDQVISKSIKLASNIL